MFFVRVTRRVLCSVSFPKTRSNFNLDWARQVCQFWCGFFSACSNFKTVFGPQGGAFDCASGGGEATLPVRCDTFNMFWGVDQFAAGIKRYGILLLHKCNFSCCFDVFIRQSWHLFGPMCVKIPLKRNFKEVFWLLKIYIYQIVSKTIKFLFVEVFI